MSIETQLKQLTNWKVELALILFCNHGLPASVEYLTAPTQSLLSSGEHSSELRPDTLLASDGDSGAEGQQGVHLLTVTTVLAIELLMIV